MDLSKKTNEELEDLLMDLCGRLELDDEEVQLLYKVEAEIDRRKGQQEVVYA